MTEEFKGSSCEQSLTRAEFIARVLKGAALTGGLLAAPKVLDKFLVPPAFAGASTCQAGHATTQGGPDTVVNLGLPQLYVFCTNNPGLGSGCSNNSDSALGTSCP